MNKGVFFDFDGVLVNSEVQHIGFTAEYLKKENINIPIEEAYVMIGGNAKMDVWSNIYNRYKNQFKDDYSTFRTKRREYCQKRIRESNYHDIMFDDVPATLKSLKEKGYFIALCSSSPMTYLDQKLSQCKIKEYFDIVLSGENFQKSKPDPDIYLTCLKHSKLNRKDVFVVEDSPYGIKAAKSAGLTTIVKRDNIFGLDQRGGDFYIDNISEILPFIEDWNDKINI